MLLLNAGVRLAASCAKLKIILSGLLLLLLFFVNAIAMLWNLSCTKEDLIDRTRATQIQV